MDQIFHDRWLDMGAVFLTFAVYTLPDGQLAIDSYDHIARTMWVQMVTFISCQKRKNRRTQATSNELCQRSAADGFDQSTNSEYGEGQRSRSVAFEFIR